MSDPIVLIPARLAATRLPNKPLAEIAGEPMIVHVWRRARRGRNRPGRGGDRCPGHRRGHRGGRRHRRHDPGRSRLRLRPHLRGCGKARSGGPSRRGRERAGRPADHRSGGHRRLHRPARGSGRRYRDPRRRHRAGGGEDQSQRGEDGGQPRRARPLPRALFHPRDGALRRRAALSSHRPLRLSPQGAAALRRPAAVAAGDAREAGAAAGARGRHAHRCGRSSTTCPSASIPPTIWKGRARSSRPGGQS